MEVTVKQLEDAIRGKLAERQGFLDQANGCAGAIALLQSQLAEAKKAKTKASSKRSDK